MFFFQTAKFAFFEVLESKNEIDNNNDNKNNNNDNNDNNNNNNIEMVASCVLPRSLFSHRKRLSSVLETSPW